jgi:hypothetical protein
MVSPPDGNRQPIAAKGRYDVAGSGAYERMPGALGAQETFMKQLAAFAVLAIAIPFAHAADPACMTAAKDKKLAGAAQKSFVQKCEKEAQAKCELAADEKKLKGAAKSSNVKKCVRETGPAA